MPAPQVEIKRGVAAAGGGGGGGQSLATEVAGDVVRNIFPRKLYFCCYRTVAGWKTHDGVCIDQSIARR